MTPCWAPFSVKSNFIYKINVYLSCGMVLAGSGDVIFGIANIETAEFGIEALATEAKQFSRGGAIILCQL